MKDDMTTASTAPPLLLSIHNWRLEMLGAHLSGRTLLLLLLLMRRLLMRRLLRHLSLLRLWRRRSQLVQLHVAYVYLGRER
jgi:hypothetical protein